MSTISWRRAQSGNWASAPNWDFGSVPTSADDVLFGLPGSYSVSVTSSVTADNLSFNAPGATLVETGGSLHLLGALSIYGGFVSLNKASAIGTSVLLAGGTLGIANGAALGSAGLLFSGGELLATATETVANSATLSGAPTIGVAAGQTLILSGNTVLKGPVTLTFGAPGSAGTVVWTSAIQLSGASEYNLDVAAGTLQFGNLNSGLTALSSAWHLVDIEAGATLDIHGSPSHFNQLTGNGTLTTAAQTSVAIDGGTFGGSITGGEITLTINGQVDFAGHSDVNSVKIGNVSTLTNDIGGTFEFDTTADISVATNASNAIFVNRGMFLRTGLGGSSTVSADFFNYGTMLITAGSMTFTGGLQNIGIIEGNLTTNPGGSITWTPSLFAFLPSYHGGSGDNVFDLSSAPGSVDGGAGTNTIDVSASMSFFANSVVNVQRFVVEDGVSADLSHLLSGESILLASVAGGDSSVTGTKGADTITGGSGIDTAVYSVARANATITRHTNDTVTVSDTQDGADTLSGVEWAQFTDQKVWLGPAYDDFNGDGFSDMLWQNNTGQAAIWEMDGSNLIGAANVGTNPGPTWKAIKTGDFDGNGFSDILWQNANGQVSLWEMNGLSVVSMANVGNTPDPHLKVVGAGDLNGDGKTDIVLQADDGDVVVWDMSGSNILDAATVANPSLAWHVVGTGDFTGDGTADIIFQNNDGSLANWDMNGTSLVGGVVLPQNPGPAWSVRGTGDFNGDGISDLLFQNTDGRVAIWDMSSATNILDAAVVVNPGTAWRVMGAADFNGDGKSDIMLQNSLDGSAAAWFMNGTAIASAAVVADPGTPWHPVF